MLADFAAEFLAEDAVATAVEEVDHQANGEPDEKAHQLAAGRESIRSKQSAMPRTARQGRMDSGKGVRASGFVRRMMSTACTDDDESEKRADVGQMQQRIDRQERRSSARRRRR